MAEWRRKFYRSKMVYGGKKAYFVKHFGRCTSPGPVSIRATPPLYKDTLYQKLRDISQMNCRLFSIIYSKMFLGKFSQLTVMQLPPGQTDPFATHGKSLTCALSWPCWCWLQNASGIWALLDFVWFQNV